MTIYFYLSLFCILISAFIFIESKRKQFSRNNIYIFLSIFLILISSFRWKVGGDWVSYLFIYERATYSYPLFDWSLSYEFLNSFVSLIGGGI